jgi:hypothetical protein
MSTVDQVSLSFTSPRQLPNPSRLVGRVVVLDVAFAADGMGTSFAGITKRFIDGLGSRLAAWVDHHDHDRHSDYRGDDRFVLATKAEHGACPEMISPALVQRVGPVDSIVCHLDLDGLYAAAKWLRGGSEPYAGADDDARAIDTRTGSPSALAIRIDHALRARFRDEALKHRIVRYLVGGAHDSSHGQVIVEAAAEFAAMGAETVRLCGLYERRGQVAFIDAQKHARRAFDKTDLLLHGQTLAPISIVRHAGFITLAAGFDSGIDFVKLFALQGGMPTRVSLPESRLDEVLGHLGA